MLREIEFTMDAGRDAGKTFKITELPAVQMDRWLTRLLGCFATQEITIYDLQEMTFAQLSNCIYKIDSEEEKELLFSELLESCSLKKEGIFIPMKGDNINSFVEDWRTLFRLKEEALKLNLGFFEDGEESTSS